jgi:hypothetical protein
VGKVYASGPPGVEHTSRLGSRDLVANGVKCRSYGGKNIKMKLCTVSWLSLKTKVKRRRRVGEDRSVRGPVDGRSWL